VRRHLPHPRAFNVNPGITTIQILIVDGSAVETEDWHSGNLLNLGLATILSGLCPVRIRYDRNNGFANRRELVMVPLKAAVAQIRWATWGKQTLSCKA